MVFNRPPRTIFGLFKMRNQHIKVVKEFKYLGITLSTKRLTNLYTRHFAIVMEKAKRRLQCIRHLGFHADGLRIETAIRMYKLLVRPLLEYGAQVLIYRNYYLPSADGHTDSQFSTTDYTHKLEHFQTQALKRLLNCPKHISPSLVRLFAGVDSLACRFDLLKLRFFWKLSHSPRESVSKLVYKYVRHRFLGTNKGFLHEVFNLCCKYRNINIWHGVCPSSSRKLNPLTWIKNIVVKRNYSIDITIARGKNCVYSYLFIRDTSPFKWVFEKYKFIFKRIGFFQNFDARKRFERQY